MVENSGDKRRGTVKSKEATETSRCDDFRKQAGNTPHIDGNKHV